MSIMDNCFKEQFYLSIISCVYQVKEDRGFVLHGV